VATPLHGLRVYRVPEVEFFAAGVHELLHGVGGDGSNRDVSVDEPGEVVQVDVVRLPGDRLLRFDSEFCAVGHEHVVEADRPHDRFLLFQPAVGEEKRADVGPVGDCEPPFHKPQVFSSLTRHVSASLRAVAITLT
jgi:hypothetical protein